MQPIIYICNAIDETIKKERQITTDSPAATIKVISIATMLIKNKYPCYVLSLGRGRQNGSKKWFKAKVGRINGVPILYCEFWHYPFLTYLVTTLSLLRFVLFLWWRKKIKRIICYNRVYFVVPSLILARLLKFIIVLDLEDGYLNKNITFFLRQKNKITKKIFDNLCQGGVILSTSGLYNQTDHKNIFIFHKRQWLRN